MLKPLSVYFVWKIQQARPSINVSALIADLSRAKIERVQEFWRELSKTSHKL